MEKEQDVTKMDRRWMRTPLQSDPGFRGVVRILRDMKEAADWRQWKKDNPRGINY